MRLVGHDEPKALLAHRLDVDARGLVRDDQQLTLRVGHRAKLLKGRAAGMWDMRAALGC